MTTRFAYYPGCSLESTAREYDASTRATCAALGIQLDEISDWNCCGASAAHSTSHLLALALPARNLALAGDMQLDVMAPCAACYNRLALAEHELRRNDVQMERVSRIIGRRLKDLPRVRPLLEVFASDEVMELIKEKVVKPLEGLKVASYYGCLLVRPVEVAVDDAENPGSMDRIVEAIGAEPVAWPFKTECCGMNYSLSQSDMVAHLVNRILAMAKANGADCLVTACPLCQANLDLRQSLAESRYGEKYDLPVFYITQLVGLSLGLTPAQLSLSGHLVSPFEVLKAKNIA